MSTKQKSTQKIDQTTTPQAPAYVASGLEGIAGKATDLMGRDPQSFIAPMNPALSGAVSAAQGLLSGGSNPNFEQADELLHLGVRPLTGRRAASFSDPYLNQYTASVVNSSLADFDQQAGMTRAQQDLDLARTGAFGGSGSAITRSMTEDALARGRNSIGSNLRFQAQDRAFGLGAQDADRAQSADFETARNFLTGANLRTGLGATMNADRRANIGLAGELGSLQQAYDQQVAGAPINTLAQLAAIFGSQPYDLVTGQRTTGTNTGTTSTGGLGSVLGGLGTLAFGAGALGWSPFGK